MSDKEISKKPSLKDKIKLSIDNFFQREDKILNDIAGDSPFTFKRGSNWSINPETGTATFDPKFFEEKGYTPSQALFAAFHEIRCHLVETSHILQSQGGKDVYEAFKKRAKEKEWIHIWDNCRTDAKGNLTILKFAPSLKNQVKTLYRDKLFPETDYSSLPKHMQFMYAVLRDRMLPGEEIKVDSQVKEAINGLRNVNGKDILALVTDPDMDALLAHQLSDMYVEPVIATLVKNDEVEKNKKDFSDDYEDYEKRHPEPMNDEEVEKKVKQTVDKNKDKKKSNGDGKDKAYEAENKITKEEAQQYLNEFQKIEKYIDSLSEVFEKIIKSRKIKVRRLSSLEDEGVIVDPGGIIQTYVQLDTQGEAPKSMKNFEGRTIDKNAPIQFNLRLVADKSTSMEGEKAKLQRMAAVLTMEALNEFSMRLTESAPEMALELQVQTELRAFGANNETHTVLYKKLSPSLSEQERMIFFKGLLQTSGGTNDFDSLKEIETDILRLDQQIPGYIDDLRSGKKREFVILLSDGGSNDVPETKKRIQRLRQMGVKVVGVGMGESSQDIADTYQPEGIVCQKISDLPKTLQILILDEISKLSLSEVPEEVLSLVRGS